MGEELTYFTACYPGVDAYNVDKDDVNQCWELSNPFSPIIYYLQSSELYYANKYDDERICREWMYNET